MNRVILTFSYILTLLLGSANSFSFPYSKTNEIQIYTEVPESFLSESTRTCRDRIKKAGVMSQLENSLGCSNFETAEKVCGCVDLAFDKDKVEEFLKSSEIQALNKLMGNSHSLDESKLEPNSSFLSRVGKLNTIYDNMGLGGCSIDDGTPYIKTVQDNYTASRSRLSQKNEIRARQLDFQHSVFNTQLKSLGSYPIKEDLIRISKVVSEETGEPFFLETQFSTVIKSPEDEKQVIIGIKDSIIDDYVRMHMKEIRSGVPSEEFKIQKVKREGCKKLMSYVSTIKEEDLRDKIERNFSTFFPESYIEKGNSELEKLERRKVVESSISDLESNFSMTGTASFKKDIFYCSKYNELKMRSEEISQNEDLKLAMAQLENLKESTLPSFIDGSNPQALQEVRDQIAALEKDIKERFNLTDEGLRYTYMGLKIWKVDKGVTSSVDETGKITFHDMSGKENTQSFSERVQSRRKSMDRSALSFTNKRKTLNRNFDFASTSEVTPVKSIASKDYQVAPASRPTTSVNKTQRDNFFSRTSMNSAIERESRTFRDSGNENKLSESKEDSSNNSYDDYLSKRISKLKNDQLSTEKKLSDELASTKESLEIAKLREELRAQSEEITKLSKKREEAPAVEVISSADSSSTPVSFKSPLASALDNSYIDNSSEEQTSRAIDNTGSRTAASATSYTGGVEQAVSSNPGASTNGSVSSGLDDGGSVSGISLTSLKSFGDDVQVIDNSVLGEIRPIQVDASFADLSEEDKRLKIEELLETTQDEEVYIEFPDGKVLKFSKKEDLKKKNDAKLKDEKKARKEKIKNRSIFSYDKLKEIFDDSKESDSRP